MIRIENALQFISAQERDVWVAMAMAVKSEVGDAGFDIWNQWSQSASNYNERAARAVWKSCAGAGITVATLFHEAKQNGWQDQCHQRPPQEQITAMKVAAAECATKDGQNRILAACMAAKRAKWVLDQCKPERHAYLYSKGFPELEGLVWRPKQEVNLLCIPMFVDRKLCGLQMIDRHGTKRFLSGQKTSQAEHCIATGGVGARDWFCEGYATSLSLRECLHALREKYRIHATMSAGNMVKVSNRYAGGFVVADNDQSGTGERAAIATGMPYYMPVLIGEDFNDFHRRVGTFRASQMLRKWLVAQKQVESNGISHGMRSASVAESIAHPGQSP